MSFKGGREGTFRRDLLYRLNTITFDLPLLRDRRDEIPPLAELFLKQTCEAWNKHVERIDPAVFEAFQRYNRPGNIRQLRNTIDRALVSTQGDSIACEDLPDFFSQSELSSQPPISTDPPASDSSDSD